MTSKNHTPTKTQHSLHNKLAIPISFLTFIIITSKEGSSILQNTEMTLFCCENIIHQNIYCLNIKNMKLWNLKRSSYRLLFAYNYLWQTSINAMHRIGLSTCFL